MLNHSNWPTVLLGLGVVAVLVFTLVSIAAPQWLTILWSSLMGL